MNFESKKVAFKHDVKLWSEKIKVNPTQVRVQKMTKKWASCSAKGWVSFNTQLLDMPAKFKDYVIIHELLHLQIPNHGKLFKSMMSVFLPEWKNLEVKYFRQREGVL